MAFIKSTAALILLFPPPFLQHNHIWAKDIYNSLVTNCNKPLTSRLVNLIKVSQYDRYTAQMERGRGEHTLIFDKLK